MKYIIVKRKLHRTKTVQEIPIMFPDYIAHSEIAEIVEKLVGGQTVSAGEFTSTVFSGANLHGQSISLKKKSRKKDADMIAMHDYRHGLS